MPYMPTLPLHHGCFDSQSTMRVESSYSSTAYSSVGMPSEPPVPRTST